MFPVGTVLDVATWQGGDDGPVGRPTDERLGLLEAPLDDEVALLAHRVAGG